MNYTFTQNKLTFTLKSNYLEEPITFSIKRKNPPTPAVLRRLKTATQLNEKGENDYRIVRETRTPFRKWVR